MLQEIEIKWVPDLDINAAPKGHIDFTAVRTKPPGESMRTEYQQP